MSAVSVRDSECVIDQTFSSHTALQLMALLHADCFTPPLATWTSSFRFELLVMMLPLFKHDKTRDPIFKSLEPECKIFCKRSDLLLFVPHWHRAGNWLCACAPKPWPCHAIQWANATSQGSANQNAEVASRACVQPLCALYRSEIITAVSEFIHFCIYLIYFITK